MDARRSYRSLIRAAVVLIGVIALGAMAIGLELGDKPNEARTVVQRFVDRLDARDSAGAGALTSYPSDAADSIAGVFTGLAPGTVQYHLIQLINLNATNAFFTIDVAWHFGPHRDWIYTVRGTAVKLSVGWRISWDPAIVVPGLGDGRTIRLVRTYAPSPRVLAADGTFLMTEQPVNVVSVDPTRTSDPNGSARALAAAIAPVAPLATAEVIQRALAGSPRRSVTAVVLRDDAYSEVAPQLASIPAVVVTRQTKLLTVDRRVDSPLLDVFHDIWQGGRDATAGWAVRIFDSTGTAIAQPAGYQGPGEPDIVTTLDPRTQLAAEDAVVSAASPASLVAIRPSTGEVLAVAQNDPATAEGPVALAGLEPVGDIFDLINQGVAAGDNEPPDHVSCDQLSSVLQQLGITTRARFTLHAGAGTVSLDRDRPHHCDRIRADTFGLALAAAGIENGATPTPTITAGSHHQRPTTPLPAAMVNRMRQIIQDATVNPEYATHLGVFPGLFGYTCYAGPAQWFMGYRGDLAIAIHISDTTSDGGDAASRMAAWMFHSLDRPAV